MVHYHCPIMYCIIGIVIENSHVGTCNLPRPTKHTLVLEWILGIPPRTFYIKLNKIYDTFNTIVLVNRSYSSINI